MTLTRKRRKELRKLKGSAEELWGHQQDVLSTASAVLAEAGKQLGAVTKEEVVPRVSAAYQAKVKPGFDKGYASAAKYATAARSKVTDDIAPAVASVVGSAAAVIDSVRKGKGLPAPVPVKKGIGVGGVIAIGIGVAAAAAVGYALWQTFRADDELWISDEGDDATV